MKLSRQWLLISAAILVLVTHVGALKATSLIHAKKNVTTTEATPVTADGAADENAGEAEAPAEEEYFTDSYGVKHKLTGIPQVDYIYDPNLPRELNGYNLSNYPFLENVPADNELDIDCNKMTDGYYASIRWKCQLYHHCLSGFRANFICPNFTVFDQRTFNCLFANTVDCDKSPNFYFRNDGIYADPTTKPPPTTTTTTTTTPAPPPARPLRPLRRPLRRRRPQADYYYDDEEADYDDDYYEERMRRRKQRPRHRRPIYDDDYEDDRIQRRPATKSRNRGRDDNDDMEEDDRRTSSRVKSRTRPSDSRRNSTPPVDRDRRPYDDRRPINEGRSQSGDRKTYDRKKPSATYADDGEIVDESPPPTKKTTRTSSVNDRRQSNFNRRYPTSESRRPAVEEEEEAIEDDVEDSMFDNKRPDKRTQNQNVEARLPAKSEPALVVKPTGPGSSVFGQPRAPPIIRRPVPKNERDKYAYKPEKATPTSTAAPETEYYDEYEDAPVEGDKMPAKVEEPKQQSASSFQNERRPFEPTAGGTEDIVDETPRHFQNGRTRNTQSDQYEDERDTSKERILSSKQAPSNKYEQRDSGNRHSLKDGGRTSPKKIYTERQTFLMSQDYESRESGEQNNRQVSNPKYSPGRNENFRPTAEGSDEVRPVVRVVKRPFLPSRGGSSSLPRGLQPVGFAKMTDVIPPTSTMSIAMTAAEFLERSPPILRQTTSSYDTGPSRMVPKYKVPESEFRPILPSAPAHVPKTSLDDIDENEYDVTLNDALNPTLKPLTSTRNSSPITFSFYNKYSDRNRYSNPQFASPEQSYAPSEFRKIYVRAPVQVPMHSRNVFPYSFTTF